MNSLEIENRIADLEFELNYLKSGKADNLLHDEILENKEFSFSDLVDCSQLQDLMNDFYELVGLGMAVTDSKNKVLVATGWQDVCTRFHRVNPETCRKCEESDDYIIKMRNVTEPIEYKCKNGMWDIGSPIVVDGKVLAGVYFGQFFYDDETIDFEFFQKQAETYGFDKTEYLNQLKKVPIVSRKKVRTLITYYAKLAQFIADIGYKNLIIKREQIHDRIIAQQKLIESESKFKNFVQHSPAIIYKYSNLRGGLFWSDRVTDILGFLPEEILQNPFIWYNSIHPDDIMSVQKAIEDHQKGEDYNIEYRIKTKSGKWIWLHDYFMHKELIGNEIIIEGHASDITTRKLAEKEQQQSQNFLNNIIEHSPNSLGILDEKGTLIRMNQACRDTLHIKDYEVVGRYNILKDNIVEEQGFMPLVNDVFEKGISVRFVISYDTSAVKYIDFEQTTNVFLDVNISPVVNEQGKVINAIIQHVDISERMRMVNALKKSESQFKNMFERHSSIMLLVESESGQIVDANNAAANFYGYSIEELCSFNISQINTLTPTEIAQERKKASESKRNYFIFQHKLKNGDIRTVEVHSSPIDYERKQILFSIIQDITERKLAEEAVRESEEKFRLLFDTMTEGVALNEVIYNTEGEMVDYRILEVNKAFHTTADYGTKQVINNVATQLYGMTPELIKTFWITHKERNVTAYTEMVSPLNNKYFYISTSPLVNDRFVTVFFDITKRKLAEMALIEIQEELNKLLREQSIILENAPIGISKVIDRKRVWVNKEMEKISGYSKDELMNETSRKHYVSDEIYERIGKEAYSELSKGITFETVREFICRDGKHKLIKSIGKAVEPQDMSKGTIWLLEDITESKQAELKIQQQNAELIKLNSDKDRFISILAHDLKSPFNSILGFLNLLVTNIRKYDIDKIEWQIKLVNESAQRVYNLLEDILLWARTQSGKIPFEPQIFNFDNLCNDVISHLELTANNKNITINHFSSGEIQIFADYNMLNTILRNMLESGLKRS